ncbi:MAG: hypothetical protein H6739_34625 [Alphaproteobacteria bacterium]|nr:hypothetical protein [Alphaproteobacteria bacterium]
MTVDDVLARFQVPGVTEVEVSRFARRHRAELERILDAALADAGWSWFDRRGHQAAPRPGERGYRPPPKPPPCALNGRSPGEVATTAIDRATELMEDPEFFQAWTTPRGTPDADWTQEDLPDLLGVPLSDAGGHRASFAWRLSLAVDAIRLAMEIDPMRAEGRDLERYSRGEGYALPRWAAVAVLEDHLAPAGRLRLVNVSKETARDFIAKHHRHLPRLNPRGLMYALGACLGRRLVAVATAGTPTGRWASPGEVIELTRVASDGTVQNAASMLVSRLVDLAPRSVEGSGWRFVTYQFSTEQGAVYKALRGKGLRPVACVAGRRPGGRRRGSRSGRPEVSKIRWEAGPLAGPADWSLLKGGCG